MRRFIVIPLVVVAAATALGVGAVVTRTDDSTGVSRVERVISSQWGSNCEFDFCGLVGVDIPYTTPAEFQAVDITVTITFDYRTSPGDAVHVELAIVDDSGGFQHMRPRNYSLRPSTNPTTATLTWIRRDLVAAGKAYTLRFGGATGIDPNGHTSVSGKRLTVVIESWTAGD
jgi:hypothetical protein